MAETTVKRKVSGLVGKSTEPIKSDYLLRMQKLAKEEEQRSQFSPLSESDSLLLPATKEETVAGIEIRMLPMTLIDKSPFQPRTELSHEHIAELAESIRADGINSPVTLRPMAGGRYELIAGENRFEAYKLNGEEFIPVIIKHCDDIQAARSTIFDNVKRKNLTDYELFRGYDILLKMKAVSSVRQLAKDAGVTHTQMNRVMCFGRLPKDAIEILNKKPSLIGATVAEAICSYAENESGSILITEALKKINEGSLQQTKAASWIENHIHPKASVSRLAVTSTQGKKFASLENDGKMFKIKLDANVDQSDFESALYEFLKMKADQEVEEQ